MTLEGCADHDGGEVRGWVELHRDGETWTAHAYVRGQTAAEAVVIARDADEAVEHAAEFMVEAAMENDAILGEEGQ